MPERKNLFSQAENHRYNVSNVLSDTAYEKTDKIPPTPETETQPEINLEEGAPFLDGIDPDATIGDYIELNEEEDLDFTDRSLEDLEEPETQEAPQSDPEEPAKQGSLQSPAIREQAEKARASFIDDLDALADEPAIQRSHASQEPEEDIPQESPEAPLDVYDQIAREEEQNTLTYEDDDEPEPDPLTFKDLLKPAARRIKKPRFAKKQDPAEDLDAFIEESEESEEPLSQENAAAEDYDSVIMQEPQQEAAEDYDQLQEDLAQARAAQKRGQSICDDLYHLQTLLEDGRSPFMHKTEVLVPREKTLRLIRSLTAICEVDPSYIDSASEDKLIDKLVSEHTEDDYKPLERARSRAQAILQDATRQADTIISDAKTLARQLLAETQAEIQEKFDAADEQIAVRMTTTKEESTKKLNQARTELTTSRQRSVEILSKYLEKAENDYQGYWERAEHTVIASLEQSESILAKAADIYRKELLAIHQDKEELDEILEHLKKYKKRK